MAKYIDRTTNLGIRTMDKLLKNEQEIRDAADRGESQNHIAARYGVSATTLGKFLKQRGIKTHTRKGKRGSDYCLGKKASGLVPTLGWRHIPVKDYTPSDQVADSRVDLSMAALLKKRAERQQERRKAFDNADIRVERVSFDIDRRASRHAVKRGLCERCGERKPADGGVCGICRVILRAIERQDGVVVSVG